jgi:hypothetical protein
MDKTTKKFLVDLLTYDGNKCQFLIPSNIQDYLLLDHRKKYWKDIDMIVIYKCMRHVVLH